MSTPGRLTVSSGYRCEAHNLYSWAAEAARTGDLEAVSRRSLHRAGAAADVYMEGVRGMADYRRLEDALRAAAPPSRVWTHLYAADEVRDPDNMHDYPYIHVHLLGVQRKAKPSRPTNRDGPWRRPR